MQISHKHQSCRTCKNLTNIRNPEVEKCWAGRTARVSYTLREQHHCRVGRLHRCLCLSRLCRIGSERRNNDKTARATFLLRAYKASPAVSSPASAAPHNAVSRVRRKAVSQVCISVPCVVMYRSNLAKLN